MTGPPLRDDADLALQLTVGESREFNLVSLATAGFVWTYEMEGDDGILRLTRRRGGPGDAGPLGLGRSTPERLMIKATAPGHAVIRMYQARPWETRVAPRKSFAINIQVSPS